MKKVSGFEGSQIEDYEIETEIGRGASGVCFRGKSKKNGEIYAIKKILLNSLKKFNLKEAMKQVNILKSLDHPNIIKYHDSFTDDHHLYIVMEYAAKGDLHSVPIEINQIIKRRRIKQQYFREEEIWEMAKQLLQALQYLHSKNIVHRDFKTLNIFMDHDGNLLVGDLGVSKIIKTDLGLYSRVGTPLYLAPEIIKYEKYDFKADVWGLGCVLYILSALVHPFEGKNIISLGQNIVHSEPKQIKGMSQKVNLFIMKMLEKNPDKRPTPKEMLGVCLLRQNDQGKQKQSTERLVTKHQYEKSKKASKEDEASLFAENYKRVRNNFVEEKKTSFTKNEEFFNKNKPIIDVTRQKNIQNTIIRKPTPDSRFRVYIPFNEETPSKLKEKTKINDVSVQEEDHIVNLESSMKNLKFSQRKHTPKNRQKIITEVHHEKSFIASDEGGRKRNVQSAKPRSQIEKQQCCSLRNEDGKKLTVSGNIQKLMYNSSQILKQKLKSREQQRPKSSITRNKGGHRNLKYVKRIPNHQMEFENILAQTQILKKPEVIIL